MDYIIELRTGKKHYLKDFTHKNPLKLAENLIAKGLFIAEGGEIPVTVQVGIEVLEAERLSLISEREQLEKEKAEFETTKQIAKRGRKPKIS